MQLSPGFRAGCQVSLATSLLWRRPTVWLDSCHTSDLRWFVSMPETSDVLIFNHCL